VKSRLSVSSEKLVRCLSFLQPRVFGLYLLRLSLSHNREAQRSFSSDIWGNGRLTSIKIEIR
jgi:hypothetical protein